MASDNEASCASDPNFAVICSFLGCFGKSCGIVFPDIARLQEMLENTQEVSRELIDLHVKLLRKTRKTVSPEKWERALVKFCHTYSNQDGWELERFGYKKARIAVKLRLLKVLLETQFDLNQKFKNEVNKLAAAELRVEPLGRDKTGLAYWCQIDEECNVRVYKEDLDEESWELVAKDREGIVSLINTLSNGEAGAIPINEDSNSLEISEKPIIDTGQVTTSPSLEDEVAQENSVSVDEVNDKSLPNGRSEFEDEQEHIQEEEEEEEEPDQDRDDIANDAENDEEEEEDVEEEEEEEEDVTNDESSKQITEEDDSQEMIETPSTERCTASSSLPATKPLNAKVEDASVKAENINHREATETSIATLSSDAGKSVTTHQPTVLMKTEIEESAPLKSIETPVITSSPLKLVNIAELKQVPEEKLVSPTASVVAPLNASQKYGSLDETTNLAAKSFDKLSNKNNLPFTDSIPVGHTKLSLKPIDQLAANLGRIQSEKLEKTSGTKSLDKIAESLARSGGILGNMANGEDDRLPQDFCARNQSEKSTTLRGHRGIDLSTSPRGWESANEQNRPVDFSGIDLSSRKTCKTMDLPSPGYRTQDFQHREMDLSTKKLSKPEVSNLYDARNMMIRNHAMVADLSKRQMAFGSYKMPYHNTSRLPVKDEHRLPSYTILPDPSKLTTLRMNTSSLKRPIENDDTQQEMLKRIRTDVLPIRSTMDKRSIMGGNWRDEVGEAIEEPMMMVQGEGSGSDCEAVNPTVEEAIEEPTIFFYGEGSGEDCETGNPGDDASTDNKESNESKSEADSAATTLSQNKVLSEDGVSTGAIVSSKPPVKLNRNFPQSSVSVNDNCQIVDSVQEKPKFKQTLGVQIITKSTSGSVKRLSRWDVGKPEEKVECDSIISNEEDISLKNTDDREHNSADQRLSETEETPKTVCEDSANVNQDVKTSDVGSSANADSETFDDSARLQVSDVSSENTSLEQKKDSELQEPVQCDSSTSPSQADVSQTFESCKNPEATIDSTDVQNVFDINSIVTCKSDASKASADNECKPNASPPRFFFGPNCISYTSKSDEDGSISSSITSVQYGCVSSSKSTDDAACPYKSEDFDLTQTNNNSLKSNLFTSESDAVLSENDNKEVEKIDRSNNELDQEAATLSSSTDPNESSDCNTTKSSVTQLQTETSEEPSVQESTPTDKKVEESDNSNLHSTATEAVAENENVDDITEEDAVDISSISKPSLLEPAESATVELPQCEQSADLEKPVSVDIEESLIERSDDVTSQLDNKEDNKSEEPADNFDNKDDHQSTSDPDVEGQEKPEVFISTHSSVSPLTQNLEKESELAANLEELEDVTKSNEPLDSAEPVNSQQSSTLERNDPTSAEDESCDNQIDKNDNFSETDGQEDRSIDTDNERIKSLASSDADSTYVNYDKNSERTDVLSDMGLQDDGSGDSEDIKEKEDLNDAQVNDTLFDVDSHFPVNSAITSSESVEENDKHRLVPTISSPDSACAQDSRPQKSEPQEIEPVQTDIEKLEITDLSSVTDNKPTFSVLPPVPEIKQTTEETNLSNLIQSTSEYVDDVSENPSPCIDQDSNEDMVIDDPVSESNESSKEPEEVTTNDEQLRDNAASEVRAESEEKAVVAESCQQTTIESEILQKSEVDAESENNRKKEEDDEIKTCDNDEQNAVIAEDVCDNSKTVEIAESTEKSETDAISVAAEQSDIETPNVASQEFSQEKIMDDNRQSLVANYNSDSNDDISDDVFESDVAQANDSKSDIVVSSEQNPTEELNEKSIKELDEESIKELDEKSIKELDEKSIKELDEESIKELDEESIKELDAESIKELDAESIKELDETSIKQLDEKSIKELDEKSIKELDEKSIKESDEKSIEELDEKSVKELDEESTEECDVNNANLVPNVPKEQLSVEVVEQQEEKFVELKTSKISNENAALVEQDVKINTQKCDNNECIDKVRTESVCNNIEYSNDKSTMSLKENELVEETDISAVNSVKTSEVSDAAKVASIAEETTEPHLNKTFEMTAGHNEKNKEYVNNFIDNVRTVQDTPSVHDTSNILEMTQKTDCSPESVRDLSSDDVNKFIKSSLAEEELNAVDRQVAGVFHMKEQHLRNLDDKLNVNFDTENIARLKTVNEHFAEELSIPCKRFKEDLVDYDNQDNKWDVKSQEECLPNKSFVQEASLPPLQTTTSDIVPVKSDNVLTVDKSNVNLEESMSSSDALYYPNSMSEKMEDVNNLDSCNNQNESFIIDTNVNKITENFDEKSPSVGDNEFSDSFSTQETISEIGVMKSDIKKEASKRLIDSSDTEDVPPVKSKPSYVETDDKMLEDLKSTDVQTPKSFETYNEIEKAEPGVEEETKSPAISMAPQNNFATVNADSAAITSIDDDSKKIDLEVAEEKEELSEIPDIEIKTISAVSDDSTGMDNEDVFNVQPEEADPLACTDDDTLKNFENASDASKISIRVKPASELVYEGWKLDSTTMEAPKISRKRRNSANESNSEDGGKQEDEEMMGGKRIKLRAKRMPDKELRKTVEESRDVIMSSEDEAAKCDLDNATQLTNKDGNNDDLNMAQSIAIDKKIRGRPRGRRRRGFRGGGRPKPKLAEFQGDSALDVSSGVHPDGTPNDLNTTSTDASAQKKRKKRKMVLGLEIGRDISLESESIPVVQDETPVRQSRRIAQLKIKEQADRRRIEEETMRELEEKKESEKKKRKKQKPESEEEEVIIKEIEKEKKSKKKRRKRKKKKMLAKFNEANPWQSSSGSSSDEENDNEDEDEDEDIIESEGSLLFKSDHEFSPESDLEKDQESEPLRRARTAQKAQSDVEEADDEYACQKCGKADHPEWILLCDSCDKGWHCSCLRPALMLIPEGDWFCPPCQHNLLVNKLRETVKTFDQLTKRHENEVLRKKRLAFVGISLDNVLHKGESQRASKGSKASSQESDDSSESSSSGSTSETTSSEESEPVYQLRERRCANTYKFNEYDDMINAAIQDEVEAVQGAGNQGRGKDIATIVNAEKEEAQAEALKMTQLEEDKDEMDESKPEKESDEEYKIENEDIIDEVEEEQNTVAKKLLARKKHRKLNSLDISSEDDPESDEDFKGTSSEEEEDFDDHITSSDDSFADVKRRGRKSDSRPVRRSTRARMTRAYDDDFINDDSEESDRPKRKKSSVWGDSDSEDSDNSWRQRKKKSRTVPMSRVRTAPKTKGKKKKKRKRIIESDNQSENDEEENEMKVKEQCEPNLQAVGTTELNEMLDINKQENFENNTGENNVEIKDDRLQEAVSEVPISQVTQSEEMVPNQKIKKDIAPKPKKTIRRKVIYGRLPDENRQEEEEILSRRTRGRKINYREEMDSEEEMKKLSLMMRKTGDSEDEFVVNEGDDINDDGDKDSDSGDVYIPKKDALKFKNKSPKAKRPRNGRSPGAKRKSLSDDVPKQRKKPGPKPGSKHRGRKKLNADTDRDMISAVMDNPIGDLASKIDENLSDNVGLMATTMSVASSFTGDVPEGSLTGLGAGELADLDEEQLEQMMDEEYGRRQLELAAIEIAKKKKKEEREAKKLEKARLKALEILAAERQRDPNAPEGMDGEAPKKKKRGRRSKAEILAEQMRRDGAPNLGIVPSGGGVGMPDGTGNVPHGVSPVLTAGLTPETDRSGEGGHMPLMTGPDGQLFNPDGMPMKPKRRGRGKGKKTLALEAARAAEAAAKAAAEVGLIGMGTDSNPEMKQNDLPNILPTPGSSTSGSAPSTPPASAVPTPGPPSTQPSNSQPVYPSLPPGQQSSVITRMLQSQPVSSSPQSFTAAAAAMGHKYFGNPTAGGQMMGGPRTGYEMQPRARIPSPYRQAGQTMPHFAAVRSGTPPMRMRVPGPQMYHTTHHPMDPSPSGGGPISINNRDRSSPLTPGGPAMIPPSAGSPLAKGGPTPPPPPPYVRGGPPMARFAENPMGPRHQMPPFTNASPVNHNIQQPSPPPNRPPGNFSPYHPPPPPNYHYGAYPPPPPMTTADDAAAYQGSPYPAEHFSSPADNQPPMQGPPQGPQSHPGDPEEGTGEFGGLVSYFSSQREDDLDS